jgi:hypothetical protein
MQLTVLCEKFTYNGQAVEGGAEHSDTETRKFRVKKWQTVDGMYKAALGKVAKNQETVPFAVMKESGET